jgi:hypothetical protein
MGFKRDKEKERLKKHHLDQKLARAKTAITILLNAPTTMAIREVPVEAVQQLTMRHLKLIVNNPSKFTNFVNLHKLATDIFTEKTLKLERES